MDVEQRQFDQPAYATATVAPGAANVAEVTITVRNLNGGIAGGGCFFLFLSDSPAGVGLTAVTASGNVGCKTQITLGTDMAVLVAKKALLVQSRLGFVAGTYVLSITDTAKTPFKICVQIRGIMQVVATLSAASYG